MNNKKNYTVEESYVKGDTLVLFYVPLGFPAWTYRWLVQKCNDRGISCVVYDYDSDIFLKNTDPEVGHLFYKRLVSNGKKQIKKGQEQGITKFVCYGTSVGSLIANLVARRNEEVSHVVLNLSHGDIAENLWFYLPARGLTKKLRDMGYTKKKFRDEFFYVDPVLTANELVGKKVLLHIAQNDVVMQYENSLKTKHAMEEAGVDMVYHESKLGHFVSGLKLILNMDEFFNFIEHGK